jgi:DNA-binding Lrp family transcriptional regulator
MVDLAAALGVTPSTAGRMCDRLLRKGLIRRHRARSDRRALTGDFTLTLPVMVAVAVAVATAASRALSYGTIYTTKLLRRGQRARHRQLAARLLPGLGAARPRAAGPRSRHDPGAG